MTRNDIETYRLAKRRTWRLAQAIQMGRRFCPLLENISISKMRCFALLQLKQIIKI